MSREVMQQALDMLNEIADHVYFDQKLEGVITALRQALETEQEPVAWLSEGGDVSRSKRYMDEMGFKCNPLYTAPPKKQWVELTLKEILINRHLIDWTSEWSYVEFAREIERALKEKNT